MRSHPAPTPSTPAEALADALLRTEGQLVQIIDHMVRAAPQVKPGSPSLPEALMSVLSDVLEPLVDARGEDVVKAIELIDAALDVIADEIFLVPLDAPPLARPRTGNRAERRRRRPA